MNQMTLRPIDTALAQQLSDSERRLWLQRYGQEIPDSTLTLFSQLVIELSLALSRGDVCIPLEKLPRVESTTDSAELDQCISIHTVSKETLFIANNPYELIIDYPIVIANGKAYFSRYWFYERQVFHAVYSRLEHSHEISDKLANTLQTLFPEAHDVNGSDVNRPELKEPDWQMIAAANTCLNDMSVITGGPGTGKTTTVTRLLVALLMENPQLNIALAAPTGKAAARLTESIRAAKHKLLTEFPAARFIPENSFTLHRLLGWRPNGFTYHHHKPLPYDLVVVDEASMVDLPMMAQLMEALSDKTRLLLLGDKDQLASVEAGSVLGDLCDSGVVVNDYPAHGLLQSRAAQLNELCALTARNIDVQQYVGQSSALMVNALTQLRKSYRFNDQSGIGQLALFINQGQPELAKQQFNTFDDIQYHASLPALYERDVSAESRAAEQAWQQQVIAGYGEYLKGIQQNEAPNVVLDKFNNFQLLCALREGTAGLEGLNERVQFLLQKKGLLQDSSDLRWYVGRPVMIVRNDYELNLFNGDIGIAMLVDGELRVCFPDSELSISKSIEKGVRKILPSRLPEHETAFAMTVHKSQGSEFSDVALVLPEKHNPVITRELIYTAITRGKKTFSLYSNENVFTAGVAEKITRASGLRELLFHNFEG